MKNIFSKIKRILVISIFFSLFLPTINSQPLPPPGNQGLPPAEGLQPNPPVQPSNTFGPQLSPGPSGLSTPPPPQMNGNQPAPPPPGPPLNPGIPNTPPGWGAAGFLANPPAGNINEGTINVMATGYDNESVLVQIPLVVSYSFNGVYYNVNVLNSWNPLTQTWNIGVDQPAYQTSYYFNGFNYNYYTNLPSGTYYFNL